MQIPTSEVLLELDTLVPDTNHEAAVSVVQTIHFGTSLDECTVLHEIGTYRSVYTME